MLRQTLRRFERAYPGLSPWLGDRPDLQVPALGMSLATHLAILLAFGMIGYAAHTERASGFRSEVVETALPELLRMETDTAELAEIDRPQVLVPTAGSFAPVVAPISVAAAAPIATTSSGTAAPPAGLAQPQVARAAEIVSPMATRLDQAVSIRGSGSEHVGDVEGAVDRIAVEIMRRMERGRTLVVWAFDASGSLVSERRRLGEHIGRVYADVLRLDDQAIARDGGLMTSVVAFGKDRKVMTREPTADAAEVAAAIADVPIDESGVESTFRTVAEAVRRYGKYRRGGEAYQTMVIVVTDEVGDDEEALEPAIAAATAAKVPVFVLGSPAVFGRAEGFMDYTDPKSGRTYRRIPVRQGPESAALEQVRLPFWYGGPQYETLDAGFGPYALSRLAGATGGIYFVTRMGKDRPTFDPTGMREYKPDWVARDQYEAAVARHPVRQAALQAARITQQDSLPARPGLTFPAADAPDFKEAMGRSQVTVARIADTVDRALEPIEAAAKLRDRETSRRWRAHFDLIRGRLLAAKLRCYEYNWACAQMKKDAPRFTRADSNAWRLVPDAQIRYSDKAVSAAEEARTLLQRVVDDHPGTPWALLARRELKDPFGFRWVETYVPPRPRPSEAAATKKAMPKGNAPTPRSEAIPKL